MTSNRKAKILSSENQQYEGNEDEPPVLKNLVVKDQVLDEMVDKLYNLGSIVQTRAEGFGGGPCFGSVMSMYCCET